MIRGLYTAASGLIAGLKRQEVIADNLANVETVGYKANETASQAFSQLLILERSKFGAFGPNTVRPLGGLGTGTFLNAQAINFAQGSLARTGNPLDLAIQSEGYFVIQTPQGLRYTRDGQFRQDAEGRIVTSDGLQVLAEGNDDPIIPPAGRLSVDQRGVISVDEQEIAQLRIRQFAPDEMGREGTTRFTSAIEGAIPDQINILQGSVERSNVEPVQALTSAVGIVQTYSSSQRAFQLQTETLQKAVNEIGKVA